MRRPKRKTKSKAKAARSRSRAKTAKSKSRTAARPRSRAKAKGRPSARKAKSARARLRTRRTRPRARVARFGTALAAADATTIDQIIRTAANSAIARFDWPPNRGVAPKGYMKGMALTFARVLCKLRAGDAAATEMAKAKTGNASNDALVRYDDTFSSLGMRNDVAGADTLRHLFALMIGHGMLEASGRHCVGRDTSAGNTNANDAEAGLFQTAFNAKSASSVLPALFEHYRANPSSGFLEVFKEGVRRCAPSDAINHGSGPGKEFQRLSKECPAFCVEFAAVVLRNRPNHYGPIKRHEALVKADADRMLRDVQNLVEASPHLCAALS